MRCTGFTCPSPLRSPMASVVSVPGENKTVTIIAGKTILVKQTAPLPNNVRTESAFQLFLLQQYKQQKTTLFIFPQLEWICGGGRNKERRAIQLPRLNTHRMHSEYVCTTWPSEDIFLLFKQ